MKDWSRSILTDRVPTIGRGQSGVRNYPCWLLALRLVRQKGASHWAVQVHAQWVGGLTEQSNVDAQLSIRRDLRPFTVSRRSEAR